MEKQGAADETYKMCRSPETGSSAAEIIIEKNKQIRLLKEQLIDLQDTNETLNAKLNSERK